MKQDSKITYYSVLPTADLSSCEMMKCQHYKNKMCNDPAEYVNRFGESVCGRRDDAIAYDDYLEMIEDNPPQ